MGLITMRKRNEAGKLAACLAWDFYQNGPTPFRLDPSPVVRYPPIPIPGLASAVFTSWTAPGYKWPLVGFLGAPTIATTLFPQLSNPQQQQYLRWLPLLPGGIIVADNDDNSGCWEQIIDASKLDPAKVAFNEQTGMLLGELVNVHGCKPLLYTDDAAKPPMMLIQAPSGKHFGFAITLNIPKGTATDGSAKYGPNSQEDIIIVHAVPMIPKPESGKPST